MFGLEKLFQKERVSVKELAKLLKTSPEVLEKFDAAYKNYVITNDETTNNVFEISAKNAAENERAKWETFDIHTLDPLVNRIVDELIAQTPVYHYERDGLSRNLLPAPNGNALVTCEEVNSLPEKMRPQLTGHLMHIDLDGQPSYIELLDLYIRSRKESNPERARGFYHRFR